MIVDWNAFKVKHPNCQEAFEQLCYILFCKEHNIKTGILRYKNQIGIETEPIVINGKLISFQAKFFEHQIDKKQIIYSIRKAKEDNPGLKKIYVYINQEFSESSKKGKKKNKKQEGIENFAKSLGIEIIWRVPSHIEFQLSQPENRYLAEDHFNLGKTTYDSIEELFSHTENLLHQINTDIKFNEQRIKIDRLSILNELESSLTDPSIIVVSGEAGTGKTALIKELYFNVREKLPLFVFKALEFNIDHINNFFNHYRTNFNLTDFINFFKDIDKKVVVIDSAEKIPDIENQEPIKEFISALINNSWSVVLTTRYEYFDDLIYTITELWRRVPKKIDIGRLTIKELNDFSSRYNFALPTDQKLLQLIKIPFYLNEYLQSYNEIEKDILEEEFKSLLWTQKVQGINISNPIKLKREQCFINIAAKRANSLNFIMSDIECENYFLRSLEEDGIIGFDRQQNGYFITHDVYEEWALERYIEKTFDENANILEFFDAIGNSLAIRRAFRKWLSENIKKDVNKVTPIIDSVTTSSIPQHWRDEIIVSIQLTPYAENFYYEFKNKILTDLIFLERLIFLTRVACKEADNSSLEMLKIQLDESLQLEYLMTQPKGEGWKALIKFLYENRERLNLNTHIIIGLLQDWLFKNKKGETTRYCGLLGIYLLEREYKRSQKNQSYYVDSNIEINLSEIILHSANEIKEELKNLFDEVLQEDNYSRKSKYNKLVHLTLTSLIDFQEVVKVLPEKVIELANNFWYQVPKKDNSFHSLFNEIKESFCLTSSYEFEYFPASAYQTPIYFLLKVAPEETVGFILDFVNKTVECYVKSKFKDYIEEVEVLIDEKITIKQYISNSLWNMYRGTSSPITPYLLQSIHMALEKWLLEIGKNLDSNTIEVWLIYLLRNSKSASITAVVLSVVLAYPEKLFNVAEILFKTKEFFIYDKRRQFLDLTESKGLYSIGYGLNYQHKIYQDERLKTCEDKHRKWDLEDLMRYYQFFRSKEISEEEAEKKQKVIWNILDNYYEKLPGKNKETELDKTWRLFLARMDGRTMKPTVESRDKQILINFNPQIEPELKKYSEEAQKKTTEPMKFSSLKLWATYKFENNEEYKKYQQYEGNPQLVLKETKEIINNLQNKKDSNFYLFNYSTPAYTCSVLIRNYVDQLSNEEKEFCKDVLLECASLPLSDNYQYQISDGVEAAINTLPLLLKLFPAEIEIIKTILLLVLFDFYPIGSYKRLSDYSVEAILYNLWDISFEDAQSIFLGYLLLKSKYDELVEKIRQSNFRKDIYQISKSQVISIFIEEREKELKDIIFNRINYSNLRYIKQLDLEILETAFELIPPGTNNKVHIKFALEILPIFAKKLLNDEDRIDYSLKQRFFKKFAYFVLNRKKEEILDYIQPFIDNFTSSQEMIHFFQELIFAEDYLNHYKQFWTVWEYFYPKIVELCSRKDSGFYTNEIIKNYLLAWPYWKESAKEWHTLKDKEKLFFKKVVKDIGYCPSVFYSISKLLNSIGSRFLDDGVYWVSDMIKNHGEQLNKKLENNTMYYLEEFIRKYILINRQLMKTDKTIRDRVLTILNFLINQGSSKAYLMREDILQ